MTIAFSSPSATVYSGASGKQIFLTAFLFFAIFMEGFRVGGILIASSAILCILYTVAFNPSIPKRILPVFLITFFWIIFLSTSNSLQLTGSLKDYLYIGIVIESFLMTICLYDAISSVSVKNIANILLIFIAAEVLLQLVEYLNLFGFNSIFGGVLEYWDNVDQARVGELGNSASRVPGSFGAPTAAGFVSYFTIRCIAVLLRRRWIVYLSIVPLLLCGARAATAIFALWEILLPIFSPRYRKVGMYALFVTVTCVILGILFFPELFGQLFIFNVFWDAYSHNQLAATESVFNRVYGFQWAFDRPAFTWLLGGTTANQIASFQNDVFGLDSELVMRSVQYGLPGYILIAATTLCAGYNRKDGDWWFGVVMVGFGALTNYVATNVIIFPFLILYNVCLARERDVSGWPSQTKTRGVG